MDSEAWKTTKGVCAGSVQELHRPQGLRDSDLGTKTDPKYVRTAFQERSLEKEACQVKINRFSLNNSALCTNKDDHTSSLGLGQSQVQPNQLKGLLSQWQGCRKAPCSQPAVTHSSGAALPEDRQPEDLMEMLSL